jgi:acyl-CoA synthetase (AMP-forming)/AMP-acid ligase II
MSQASRPDIFSCTVSLYDREFAGRHRLQDVVSRWARIKPHDPAIVFYNRGLSVDWAALDRVSSDLAIDLLRRGFRKGDFLATSLPMSPEHIFLEYACFKIGVIHSPLDLRLRPAEVLRSLEILRPKGFAWLIPDLAAAVREHCPFVEHCFAQPELADTIAKGAGHISPGMTSLLDESVAAVKENDGAQVIFTTGSTGSPKAALLSHRNITSQNLCLGAAFGFQDERILLNLPPSHVGGQAEVLMTALFWGGTAVALEVFDPAKSLDAIQKHKATIVGQIPAMFQFEWRVADFAKYDLSSLRKAVYGGQQVSRQFLERMAQMAPKIGTGLGLTETAGFCTYTPLTSSFEEVLAGIGYDMPLYPLTVRSEMQADGTAGKELPDGEVGNICFAGPQTFLGYVGDAASTARTISSDGILYTGDLGWRDDKGLHLSGRAKWVIKQAGYQIFPGDIEDHFCALQDKVLSCAALGAEHRLLSEGVVVFVEKKPSADLDVKELRSHARNMASYMRPLHYVILEAGQMPLNRVAKTDYVRLSELAAQEVDRLRAKGRWDR